MSENHDERPSRLRDLLPKARSLEERDHPFESNCLAALNLTPDQLKIARALDREKVSAIKIVLLVAKPRLERGGLKNTRDTAQLCLDWLPTFDQEKADGV